MKNGGDVYDTDYEGWAREQVRLLRDGRLADLDVAHLIEELEDMGRSERNELESRLTILLAHLLKWQYQYARLSEQWRGFKGDSWRTTIIEQRDRIAKRLQKSPGLQPSVEDLLKEAYEDARRLALKETCLPPETFPRRCPYTQAQVLDDGFYPDPEH